MTIAYLNGQFLPLEKTQVSAMDRGFLFGDGVYEVIPVYNGQPFRLAQHLQRLAASLNAISLVIALKNQDFEKLLTELIFLNGGGNQSIYLQVTRGPAPVRDHAFPAQIQPTIFAFSTPLITKSIAELAQGISAITAPDIRWQRCDIKAITLLSNVLLKHQANLQGALETIIIHNGFAIEASASNLFIVTSGVITTPPLDNHILGGITRDLILELAKEHDLPHQEREISEAELLTAEEIWLTSSSREIMPVIKLNQKLIGNGQAGAVWHKMIKLYQFFKEQIA